MSTQPNTLRGVIDELSLLAGARVQAVTQVGAYVVALEVFAPRLPGRRVQLLLSAEPRLAGVGVADRLMRGHGGASGHAPQMQMLLRSRVVPSTLLAVVPSVEPHGVMLVLDAPDETLTLTLLLDGGGSRRKVATLFLCDGEGRVLGRIGEAERVRAPREGERERKGDESVRDAHERVAHEPREMRGQGEEGVQGEGVQGEGVQGEGVQGERVPDVGLLLAREAWAALEAERVQQAVVAARREAQRARKKLAVLVENLARDRERAEAALAEAALASLVVHEVGQIPRGCVAWPVTLDDGQTETLALDPAKSARENFDAIFHRARRIRAAIEGIRERHEATVERVRVIDGLLGATGPAGDAAIVAAFSSKGAAGGARGGGDALGPAGRAGQTGKAGQVGRGGQGQKSAPRVPYRAFTSSDGLQILVGKTSRENDELTFRVAKASDWFLHVKAFAGSHVIIRMQKGALAPPGATLIEAALLAAWFSKSPRENRVEVAHLRRAFVRKPRGAKAGQVVLTNEKHVLVDAREALVKPILAREVV